MEMFYVARTFIRDKGEDLSKVTLTHRDCKSMKAKNDSPFFQSNLPTIFSLFRIHREPREPLSLNKQSADKKDSNQSQVMIFVNR